MSYEPQFQPAFTSASAKLPAFAPARDEAGFMDLREADVPAEALDSNVAQESGRLRRLALAFTGALAGGVLACSAIATLYIVKSAMGINIFEGPSFLHTYLYW